MEYAFLILLLYFVLTAGGVLAYEWMERRRLARVPVQLPILSGREKQEKLNELMAPFGFAYDGRQNIFYSRLDSWQRKYGYGRIYDEAAAPLNMILDCEPIYFEYGGKKWMIEFWKGQYGICTGAEVGVYYLPMNEAEGRSLGEIAPLAMYQSVSDEDMLAVQFVLWRRGQAMFLRRGYHWWLTGFSLGKFTEPQELSMDVEVTLWDEDMRDAFLEGLARAGYSNQEVSVIRNTVWVHFSKPHTPQPLFRGRFLTRLKQWENRRNCRMFARATGDYSHVYDKLMAAKVRLPQLYQKLERMGMSRLASEGK